jgi:hypothetical protein
VAGWLSVARWLPVAGLAGAAGPVEPGAELEVAAWDGGVAA